MQTLAKNDDAVNFKFAPAAVQRDAPSTRRRSRRASVVPASPAALDEVFAGLARVEAAHGPIRISPRPIDSAEIRNVATELDRQHQRLTQLLRDIDGDTTSA